MGKMLAKHPGADNHVSGEWMADRVQKELFGPDRAFEEEAEAVAKANATRFDLAASLFTRDLNRVHRVSCAIRAGTVWLNRHGSLIAEDETGDNRHSGLGRLHGPERLNDF